MFSLFIATIDTILFSGQARGVVCPGSDGELTILAHHTPLVTTLKGGVVRVLLSNGEEETFPVESGILEVAGNKAVILLP
ncbi:MAG: F0F1 ATP synthase subunit epsilon [Patescibacteria group bacterium]